MKMFALTKNRIKNVNCFANDCIDLQVCLCYDSCSFLNSFVNTLHTWLLLSDHSDN